MPFVSRILCRISSERLRKPDNRLRATPSQRYTSSMTRTVSLHADTSYRAHLNLTCTGACHEFLFGTHIVRHCTHQQLVLSLRMHRNFSLRVIKQTCIMHLLNPLQNRGKCSDRNCLVRASDPICMMLFLIIIQYRVITRIGSEGFLHLFLCHAEFATVELGWYSYPIVILQIRFYFLRLVDFRPDTLRLPISGAAASDGFCLIKLKYGLFDASGAPASSLILTLRFSFSSALSSSIMRS